METSTKLGRVSLVPRGEYDPAAQYERLDIVGYGGSSYLVLRDLQGVTPKDGADYMLLAERGLDGADGLPGQDGQDGQNGQDGQDGQDGLPGKDGEAGVGIQSIDRTSGNGAAGTTDTYTITLTDGNTSTFQVYNGADGQGAGDMTKIVYDPQGKKQDIFQYADDAANAAVEQASEANTIAQNAAQTAQSAMETAQAAATMEQVNTAIQAAILDSWEGAY